MREHWDTKRAFILAAIGSAIGLGNIWRFPFKCYENGGGAFLFAYLIAMITAGIPLLIMEMGIGHRFGLAAPLSWRTISKKYEWIGWWAVFVSFVITTYYTVVMAWSLNFSVYSLSQAWGDNPSDFFYNSFLRLTDSPFNLGGIRVPILVSLAAAWVLILASIWKGTRSVSKVVYITVFLPWLILIVFVIRSVMLPGAMEGLHYYLYPVMEKLMNPRVWVAAYGQAFYSLSIGFGLIIAYASYLKRDTDIVSSAVIIALSDGATAFVGGFAVFGSLGFYAHLNNLPVTEVLQGGPGLAFVTYPAIINQLPYSWIFGILFFLMLITLALDSCFALVESVSSSLRDKFGWGIKKSNLLVAIPGFVVGIIFTTGAGLYWLDIVDKWMEFFGLGMVILFETIVIGWFYDTGGLRQYANRPSDIKIGRSWEILLKYLIPVALAILVVSEGIRLIRIGYGDYPASALLIGGWGVALILPVIAFLAAKLRGKEKSLSPLPEPVEDLTDQTGFRHYALFQRVVIVLIVVTSVVALVARCFPRMTHFVVPVVIITMVISLVGGSVYFLKISSGNFEKREEWRERYALDQQRSSTNRARRGSRQ